MIDSTDRDALEDAMTRWVLGELPEEEAEALARLVAERPELAVELGRLQRTFGLLGHAAATTPPPHVRDRLLAAAERLDPATPAPPAAPRVVALAPPAPRPGRGRTVSRMAGAIAALLVLGLAWDGYWLRQELRLQREVATTLQQPNVVHQFALRGTGISLAAGTAVLDLDAKRAAVVIHGLPRLPAGQVYRLWARVGDDAVPCGQFNADAGGAVTSQFTIPVDAYTSPVRELFLNVEPAEAGPKPAGRTVMVGRI
jgi:hypothetical protein